MKWKALVISVMMTISTAAAAEIFEYKLSGLSHEGDMEVCRDLLSSVVTQLENRGIDILGSHCEFHELFQDRVDGVVSYIADQRFRAHSSLRGGSRGIEIEGSYRSKEACEGDLPRQIEIYKAATQLEPILAHCYRMDFLDPKHAFHIEAIGHSPVNKHITGTTIVGAPHIGWQALYDELKVKLSERLEWMSEIDIIGQMGFPRLRLSYYAVDRLYLDHHTEVKYENVDQCVANLPSIQEAFASLEVSPLTIFCDSDVNGIWGTHLNILSFHTAADRSKAFAFRRLGGSYADFESCEAEKTGVKERLVASGINVIALECGIGAESPQFYMHLFYQKN